MTPEDRELLERLRRKQLELQHSLFRLDIQLKELETRYAPEPLPEELPLPPLPTGHLPPVPPLFPPVPTDPEPALAALPALPAVPPPAPPILAPQPSLEFQFGKWLTRIGAVFFVLFVISAASWADLSWHLHQRLGHMGKLSILGFISMAVIFLGQYLERKKGNLLLYGRTLMAAGLGGLYLTFYAAYFVAHLRVITSPVVGGALLLLWSAYVFLLAERKKSQTLAVFSIFLAYFSTAINPIGYFTMGADLLLAITAVVFLVRQGWSALSYLSLIGTYAALLRRLVVDENGEFVFDTSRTLHFWPYAIYLIGAWSIFTLAVILCSDPTFRHGKRFAFLSLNNGAVAGLLALAASICGYDFGQVGETFLASGFVFLIMSRFVGWTELDPDEVMAAYAAQGLALVTAGVMVVFSGMTRGVLLMLETFFLGAAGTFAGDFVLLVTTGFAAFFATSFLIWEIAARAHHPWLFSIGGGIVLIINAWWSRAEIRDSPKSRETVVLPTAYYCTLALGLLYTALCTQLSDAALPPDLALISLAITFLIYIVALYELPPLAQVYLLIAQALVLWPIETGESLPDSSALIVAGVTVVAITWWTRQRVTRSGAWILLLKLVYACALVGIIYNLVQPQLDPQNWMIATAFLSTAFFAYGACYRVGILAAIGQIFLALSVYSFFIPPGGWTFPNSPWNWWAAAVPLLVVFYSGKATHAWLDLIPPIRESLQSFLRGLAYGYQLLALAMLVRWIFAHVPHADQIASFFILATILIAWNVRTSSAFGVYCGLITSALGLMLYLHRFTTEALPMATFLNALALLFFLAQPALLRRAKKSLVTEFESWALVLASVSFGWLFTSAWVALRIHPSYLTMGWALYGFFLFAFSLFVQEKRLRWCGLAIILAAIVRVFLCDFWGFSNGYRVLTLIVLTLITLGLGFIYARFADRLKTWL